VNPASSTGAPKIAEPRVWGRCGTSQLITSWRLNDQASTSRSAPASPAFAAGRASAGRRSATTNTSTTASPAAATRAADSSTPGQSSTASSGPAGSNRASHHRPTAESAAQARPATTGRTRGQGGAEQLGGEGGQQPARPGGGDRRPQQPRPRPRDQHRPAVVGTAPAGEPAPADDQLGAVVGRDHPPPSAGQPVAARPDGHRASQLPLQPGHRPDGAVGLEGELSANSSGAPGWARQSLPSDHQQATLEDHSATCTTRRPPGTAVRGRSTAGAAATRPVPGATAGEPRLSSIRDTAPVSRTSGSPSRSPSAGSSNQRVPIGPIRRDRPAGPSVPGRPRPPRPAGQGQSRR
jgi:hypothetical protein